MTRVNFIPAYRTDARNRRRRIFRWLLGAGAYLVLIGGVYAYCHAMWGGPAVDFAAAQQLARRRILTQRQMLAATQAELAVAVRKLNANRVLKDLPDWSILLTAVAGSLNEHVVLDHCALAPVLESNRREAPPPDEQGAYELHVSGYAKTVQAASDLAVALENTQAFDEVRLLGTNQQPYLSGKAFHFRIRCALGTRGEEGQ